MAGDWIKVEHATPDKPEIIKIASMLGINLRETLGACIWVWLWADKHCKDGNASVTLMELDCNAGVTGFGAAMCKVGWLEETANGILFTNFDRHMSQSSKKRALTSSRVKRLRNAANVTLALPEKRREEKRRVNTTNPLPLPHDNAEFASTWEKWVEYRKASGKTLRSATISLQFKFLAGMSASEAIACLEQSMRQGWSGLFDVHKNGKPRANETSDQRAARVFGE